MNRFLVLLLVVLVGLCSAGCRYSPLVVAPTETPATLTALTTASLTAAPSQTPAPTWTVTPAPTETKPPTSTPTRVPTDTRTPTATTTDTATPTTTNTATPTATSIPSQTPRPTETATSAPVSKGLCPIDMSLPDVAVCQEYHASHDGLDICGLYGTVHRSPADCRVEYLYANAEGGQGMLLWCAELQAKFGIDLVQLAHADLAHDDYETLRWYGVPKSAFFGETGNPLPVTGLDRQVPPAQNQTVIRGGDLHLYMGSTGRSSGPHVHIGLLTRVGDGWSHVDPMLFLDCSR